MADRNVIQREFDAFRTDVGMLKKSGSWYRTTTDVVQALNLQKSQYGPSYYINVGFWLQSLGERRFPPERTWHITIRLGSLLPVQEDVITTLLDLESSVEEVDRGNHLRNLLTTRLRPILARASSMEGLRELRRRGQLKAAAVRGPAVALLDVT